MLEKYVLNTWFNTWLHLYKSNLKLTTRDRYTTIWNLYIKDSALGNMELNCIRRKDIFEFLHMLTTECGLAISTAHSVFTVLSGCLSDAVDAELLTSNPATGAFRKILRTEYIEKEALTVRQQEIFMNFIAHSPVYKRHLPMFATFLGTGLRVGELTGLTWDDIDFHNEVIHVSHTLSYLKIKGKCQFYIDKPKTYSSNRDIPLLPQLHKLLFQYKIFKNRQPSLVEISGYQNFVFTTRNDFPYTEAGINAIINRIVKKYNTQELEHACSENRSPELLPKFTPHTLRHTFCTRFCENESNVKVIQKIMGHKNIQTTMNIYTHVTEENKKAVMERFGENMRLF